MPSLHDLLNSDGYWAVFALVAIESFGIPLPGETILITAGIYAGATHQLSIAQVIVAAIAAVLVGGSCGYGVGYWGGYRLIMRYGRYVRLDERRVKLLRYLFLRQGVKLVFLGRFVSILRTYAAFFAGTTRMSWWPFFIANAAGSIVWAVFWGLTAYFLGSEISRLKTTFDVGLGALAVVAVIAVVVLVRRNEERLARDAERAFPGDGHRSGRTAAPH